MHPPTSIFLFSDDKLQACSCGRILGGSYVELDNPEPYAARRRMVELRGNLWSHEANGFLSVAFGIKEDPDMIRATHQRLPANPPGSDTCFCGGIGKNYAWALARGAP